MSAYPITLKVTIDFSSGASFGTTLLLGDPEYGKLGFNVLGDAASEVYDITSSTIQIATKRGYNLLQDQFDTGTATLRVVDPYAYWNPQNALSPFYGKQIPLRKVKITATHLGTEYDENNETKVYLNDDDKLAHFDWCWNKTIENFLKENLKFKVRGEHRDYFEKFFMELFYNADSKVIRDNIQKFFDELFDEEKAFTKSDLDMLTDVYKMLNKNLV